MPRMVRPLAMVARISAPTRIRGRLPRPPVRATPASATAVRALKMIAGLADGFASVTTAVVTRPPSDGEQPGDHEAEHLVAVAVDAGAAYRLGVAADRHQPDPVPGAGQEDRADEEDRADDEHRGGDAREVAGGEVAVGAHELELGQPGERVAARDDRGQAGQHRQGADGDDDRVEPAQRDQAVDEADHDAAAERRRRGRSRSRSRWSAASRRHSWPAPRCPAGTGRGRRS